MRNFHLSREDRYSGFVADCSMSVPIPLRRDFSAVWLRGLAKKTEDGPQARRLLTLAAIYDGATRTEAAKIGGVGLQIIRDWVIWFNAQGPEGLLDRKPPGQPSKLNDGQRQAITQIIESGPIPAVHGVVRWRLIDLAQWIFEEIRITIAKQTLSRELRAMGYRKLSARPRHHAQAAGAIEDFKKTSPRIWTQSRARRRSKKSGSQTKPGSARRTRSPAAGQSVALVLALRVISAPLPPTSSVPSAQRRARARP
jgi:transposase